ncbi:hypothetical protein DYB37_008682 [Aphanomyces astaci]|uniref:Bacterial bifunctional deaminase-reductase C-terminal domain-containing protein n=1 Tax=Aphanomyces astaci TaxID=112090 RepID=A0A418D0V6_APHAT|nr:hypothetical protein DYB35_007504 [Aphanomyces astaci]RHZ21714.1 hypothetical protein DYB37_008682 [Aphanomyces astaci]
MEVIATFTQDGLALAKQAHRLFVTLTYAQSLDGSIAAVRADNPSLTVRLVQGQIHARGIISVMVEGGASILTSCLMVQATDSQFLSHGIVTIAPLFVGGLKGVAALLPAYPRLHPVQVASLGNDVVMFGPFAPPQ